MNDIKSSNFNKYQTQNPVVRRLIDHFFKHLNDIILRLGPERVLDAGCGEGETIRRLQDLLPQQIFGVDIRDDSISIASHLTKNVSFSVQSVYKLSFDSDYFDLVLCLEVLEHLENPINAVVELVRVCRKDLIFSAPYEPYFQIGSFLRGKYISSLGNHPEHIWHWNTKSLHNLLAPYVHIQKIYVSFPWIIAHCQKGRTMPQIKR